MGAAVVEFADTAEALLACCVPYLKADGDVWVVGDDEGLGKEVGADGGLLHLFEVVVNEAVEE